MRVLLEDDQVAIKLIEVLVALDEKLLHHVVRVIHWISPRAKVGTAVDRGTQHRFRNNGK